MIVARSSRRSRGSTPASAGWFAAPSGSAGGSGSIGSPWDLQTAFNGGPSGQVQPGDTVWMRGGTYTGLYVCATNGSSGLPIEFKSYPGERPTIDGFLNTALTGSMTSIQTTVPCPQMQLPDNSVINIDSESIRIHTAYSGGAYQGVDRGWNGTTAAAHSISGTVDTDNGHCLTVAGTYTRVWNLEATVSVSRYTNRVNPQAGSNPFGRPPSGMELNGTGNKLIHCIAHDTTDGFSTSAGAADNFEIHGCLAYYIGWDASDRGHGHGFYIHNDNPATSLATIGNCIVLDSFDFNCQVYTGGTSLGNVQMDGFFSAEAGVISTWGPVLEVLMGFDPGPITTSSFTYGATYSGATPGDGMSVGYNAGNATNFTLVGNYFASQDAACIVKAGTTFAAAYGNTYVGPSSAPNPSSGTFVPWKPVSGKAFMISKSLYETGRAHIAVFNWDHSATVNLDFSSFLSVGDPYSVYSAWNPLGTPVTTGTYAGGTVAVSASGLTVSAPVGKTAPAETGTEFNIYIVRKG